MTSPITLDALRILDAIDRRGSFAAAADELFRVPSALSYSVNKLESDLGVTLFDRSRRKSELTPAGRLILEQGRHILVATEELTALAKAAESGWEVELKICVDNVINCDPVYELIEAFQQVQPKTQIRLIEEVLAGTWDALNADRCDLIIGAAGEPPTQSFGVHHLGQVEFDFVVAADHPLTQEAQPIAMSKIRHYPTLVIADSSRDLPGLNVGLLDGRSRIILPNAEHKLAALIKGLGVGYLPRHGIQHALAEGQLKVLKLEDTRAPQSLCVAWKNTNTGKALKWFVQELKQMEFDKKIGLTKYLSNNT